MAASVEQSDALQLLEGSYGLADGRLNAMKLPGSSREAARVRNGHQYAKLIEAKSAECHASQISIENIKIISLLQKFSWLHHSCMQPTYFVNHGGGPCFFLEPGPMRAAWVDLEIHLRNFAGTLSERPSSILIISGHWQATRPTVNVGASPPLLFDYEGFPDYTYELKWPAPGAPGLATRVRELLGAAGIASASDEQRGWDHGVFVPMKLMFPAADIPVLQLSMQRGLDPAAHLAIGRALRPLRDEGVLIVGSGQTFHNMRGFSGHGRSDPGADAFDAWLRTAMLDGATRANALINWDQAPGARHAQPYEDHLLPLMVAAGAAFGEPGHIDFHGQALGKPISGFRFG
jgi:aromatic ring-opening dioxygenase catalytic subunit (LigB family)